MDKKKIIIFIGTFIITGIIILGIFFWVNRSKVNTDGTTPWYQNFNPFGTPPNIPDPNSPNENPNNTEGEQTEEGGEKINSKFHKITDFAIAGATFLDDTRPIEIDPNKIMEPKEVKITLDPNTKEGRKEIQTFLNTSLSLKPALVVDGVFGKKVTEAIKSFQKLNGLKITGILDTDTSPFFTKTIITKEEIPTVEQVPSVRFVEKKNGHLYKMFLDTKIQEKISNSTIPSIYEAFFNKEGDTIIYRYLSNDKKITTYIAKLGATKGDFMEQNIIDMSISQDKQSFFYLNKNDYGTSGVVKIFNEPKKEIVFNNPLTEWISQWDKNNNIYLTTKASYTASGSIFKLNKINQTISKVFGGVLGLTTLISPNGEKLIYSSSTGNGPKLGIFNIKEHTTKDIDTYGLAEKCVWSINNVDIYCGVPNKVVGNQYPDVWYQGLVSFDDFFVKINTNTGDKSTIANSAEETPVDATYLFLNKIENSLFFTNKKDSTLWSLDLE